MNFYKFHLGDYYKKTSHLSMLEDGAYRRLMDAIYLREGPLPANIEQIYRLVRAFNDVEKAAVVSVLAEFFTLTDAGYTNARCDEELASIKDRSEKARKSAFASVQSRQRSANAQQSLSERSASHKPVTSNQVSSAHASQPLTIIHRMIALDLLDRGKADLSPWERKFLEDVCRRSTLTDKMQATFDSIASKIGLTADSVLATWQKRLEVARKLNQWDTKWGPPPHSIGCVVPDQLLQPDDGQGWTEWRVAS